jgi:serine/threonine protein kinase
MSEAKRLCMGCMEHIAVEGDVCPVCGLKKGAYENKNPNMRVGTKHKDRYIVGCEIASDELGTRYIAYDSKNDKQVIIRGAIEKKKARHFYKALLNKDKLLESAEAHINRVKDIPDYIPNTDYFMIEDEFYWVEQYSKGKTLQQFIRERGRLPYSAAMHIFVRTAKAIQKLHEKEVLYGSLSPKSIILTPKSDSLLLDTEYLVMNHTDDPKQLLDNNYLPAEYFDEDSEITKTSDVYSLACVLYFMLTGKPVMLATEREYDDVVVPPSALDVDIPKYAEKVLLKALGLYPEERIETVAEFLEQMDFEDKESYRILVDDAPLRIFLGVSQAAQAAAAASQKKPSPQEVLSLFDEEADSEAEDESLAAINKRYEQEHRQEMQLKKIAEKAKTIKEKPAPQPKRYSTAKTRLSIPVGVKIGVISFFGIILIAVALLLLGVFDLLPSQKKLALVPNIVGMTIEEAKQTLDQNGLTMLITGSEPVDSTEVGSVSSQSPVAESEIMLGDVVSINIARAEYSEQGIMPDLSYMRLDLAYEVAKRNNVRIDIKYVKNDEVLVGCVVSQSIAPGNAVSNQTVELSVSSGSALQNARIRMSETITDLRAIIVFKVNGEVYDIKSTLENTALGNNMPGNPKPPEDEELTFIGWSYGENATGYAFTNEQPCSGIVTVYAAFAPKGVVLPTAKPQPTIEVNPTDVPTPTPEPTPTLETQTPSVTSTPQRTSSPRPTTTPSSTPTATPKPTPTPTNKPTSTPTATPKPSPTPTPKPSATPTATPKPSPTPTPKPSATPTATPKPTPTPTPKPSPTPEPTPTPFIPVEGVSIAPSKVTLRVGERFKLSAIFEPTNATNRGVTWGVEDPSIATIDYNGIITGRSVGFTLAFVVTDYGFFEATCEVTVVADSSINSSTNWLSIS